MQADACLFSNEDEESREPVQQSFKYAEYYQEQATIINKFHKSMLGQKIWFGGYLSSVQEAIKLKNEITWNDFITLFCYESRSSVYECLKLFNNKELVMQQFPKLDVSIRVAMKYLNTINNKIAPTVQARFAMTYKNPAWVETKNVEIKKMDAAKDKRDNTKTDKKEIKNMHKAQTSMLDDTILDVTARLGVVLNDLKAKIDHSEATVDASPDKNKRDFKAVKNDLNGMKDDYKAISDAMTLLSDQRSMIKYLELADSKDLPDLRAKFKATVQKFAQSKNNSRAPSEKFASPVVDPVAQVDEFKADGASHVVDPVGQSQADGAQVGQVGQSQVAQAAQVGQSQVAQAAQVVESQVGQSQADGGIVGVSSNFASKSMVDNDMDSMTESLKQLGMAVPNTGGRTPCYECGNKFRAHEVVDGLCINCMNNAESKKDK